MASTGNYNSFSHKITSSTESYCDKAIAVTISDDSVNGISYYGGNNYDLLADQIIPVNKKWGKNISASKVNLL